MKTLSLRALTLILSLTLILCVSVSAQTTIPYETGFEAADGFTAGQSIDGQDGWTVLSQGADATITDAKAQAGSQSVSLEANSQIDKQLATAAGNTIIWMEGYFNGAGTTADPSFPADPEASAIVFFSQTNGIQCLNGNGSGDGSWENTGVTIDSAQWYKISIRQDYTTKKWRCYVNDAAAPASDLGFRNNIETLNGFRNFADTASFLDSFRVIPVKKGDANGDAVVDAADLITLVSDPTGSNMDLIVKDNADVDNDGSVAPADLTALISLILQKS
jgi:dockerin type I repeat protein